MLDFLAGDRLRGTINPNPKNIHEYIVDTLCVVQIKAYILPARHDTNLARTHF